MESALDNEIIFLGIAERAACVTDWSPHLLKWNIIGLKYILPCILYPLSLKGMFFGFAFRPEKIRPKYKFAIENEEKEETISFELNIAYSNAPPSLAELSTLHKTVVNRTQTGWIYFFLEPTDNSIAIHKPGKYSLVLVDDDGRKILGHLEFFEIELLPLTEEEIRAIKSEPNAIKLVVLTYECKFCKSNIKIYAGLERNHKGESEGWIWYSDAPGKFECSCRKTTIDFTTVKKNLLPSIRYYSAGQSEFNLTPLYEKSALEEIRNGLSGLLNSKPKEEKLQVYLETHSILFHQFSATKIFNKPSILTKFVADFAILSTTKDLYLIEIEKSDTRLLKRDGGMASEVSHAFDQVRDWLQVADDHRIALLDSLGIKSELVGNIRGVVIAGRDIGYESHHLRKFKGSNRERISFLTYDDLVYSLDFLINKMKSM